MSPEEFSYVITTCRLQIGMWASDAVITCNQFEQAIERQPRKMAEWLKEFGTDHNWIERFRLDFERGHFD